MSAVNCDCCTVIYEILMSLDDVLLLELINFSMNRFGNVVILSVVNCKYLCVKCVFVLKSLYSSEGAPFSSLQPSEWTKGTVSWGTIFRMTIYGYERHSHSSSLEPWRRGHTSCVLHKHSSETVTCDLTAHILYSWWKRLIFLLFLNAWNINSDGFKSVYCFSVFLNILTESLIVSSSWTCFILTSLITTWFTDPPVGSVIHLSAHWSTDTWRITWLIPRHLSRCHNITCLFV